MPEQSTCRGSTALHGGFRPRNAEGLSATYIHTTRLCIDPTTQSHHADVLEGRVAVCGSQLKRWKVVFLRFVVNLVRSVCALFARQNRVGDVFAGPAEVVGDDDDDEEVEDDGDDDDDDDDDDPHQEIVLGSDDSEEEEDGPGNVVDSLVDSPAVVVVAVVCTYFQEWACNRLPQRIKQLKQLKFYHNE